MSFKIQFASWFFFFYWGRKQNCNSNLNLRKYWSVLEFFLSWMHLNTSSPRMPCLHWIVIHLFHPSRGVWSVSFTLQLMQLFSSEFSWIANGPNTWMKLSFESHFFSSNSLNWFIKLKDWCRIWFLILLLQLTGEENDQWWLPCGPVIVSANILPEHFWFWVASLLERFGWERMSEWITFYTNYSHF